VVSHVCFQFSCCFFLRHYFILLFHHHHQNYYYFFVLLIENNSHQQQWSFGSLPGTTVQRNDRGQARAIPGTQVGVPVPGNTRYYTRTVPGIILIPGTGTWIPVQVLITLAPVVFSTARIRYKKQENWLLFK
jgi:hypothetical protein